MTNEARDPVEVAADAAVAFVGVNVVPMDAERILEDQTVLVQGGRIAEVGPQGSVRIDANATQISGHGRYLMPGLAEMHAHGRGANWPLLNIANGVTTLRVMLGEERSLRQQREPDDFGPTIYSAGPIIDGDPPILPAWSAAAGTPEEGRLAASRFGHALLSRREGSDRPTRGSGEAQRRIEELFVEGWSPAQIHKQLEKELSGQTGQRTVQRIVKDLKGRDLSGPWRLRDAPIEEAREVLPVLAEVASITEGPVVEFTRDQAHCVAKLRPLMPNWSSWLLYQLALIYTQTPEDDQDEIALDWLVGLSPLSSLKHFWAFADAAHRGVPTPAAAHSRTRSRPLRFRRRFGTGASG